mmetsp:Transcript_58217/g.188445  ORF Transcript_58217/g.188445 Transcript_58217/m.188445 type:complete len:364 (-) Transcript_58217:50-1141(-)
MPCDSACTPTAYQAHAMKCVQIAKPTRSRTIWRKVSSGAERTKSKIPSTTWRSFNRRTTRAIRMHLVIRTNRAVLPMRTTSMAWMLSMNSRTKSVVTTNKSNPNQVLKYLQAILCILISVRPSGSWKPTKKFETKSRNQNAAVNRRSTSEKLRSSNAKTTSGRVIMSYMMTRTLARSQTRRRRSVGQTMRCLTQPPSVMTSPARSCNRSAILSFDKLLTLTLPERYILLGSVAGICHSARTSGIPSCSQQGSVPAPQRQSTSTMPPLMHSSTEAAGTPVSRSETSSLEHCCSWGSEAGTETGASCSDGWASSSDGLPGDRKPRTCETGRARCGWLICASKSAEAAEAIGARPATSAPSSCSWA